MLFSFTPSITELDSIDRNFKHRLAQELLNDFRLRILGNLHSSEIFEKQKEGHSRDKSYFQFENFFNTSKELRKIIFLLFGVLSIFPDQIFCQYCFLRDPNPTKFFQSTSGLVR